MPFKNFRRSVCQLSRQLQPRSENISTAANISDKKYNTLVISIRIGAVLIAVVLAIITSLGACSTSRVHDRGSTCYLVKSAYIQAGTTR